ncbi:DUF4124 domain-containing protein [Variovorax boronicumulans]|uniref:DUF4124 domain-containing protein n=1 Tax=Variovorax boronicumulans TaxID=436515 RepID=UPI001C5827F6
MPAWRAFTFIALLCAGTPALAINKCTGVDGKVTYQETPCAASMRSTEALKIQEGPATTPEEARFNSAAARGKLIVGMPAQLVRRAWGEPTKINVSVGSYGRHEQWIYDRGSYRAQYVYVQNGIMTSIQTPSE